jgi:hypothetical protein
MNAVRDNGCTIDDHVSDTDGIPSWFVECCAIRHHRGIKYRHVSDRARAKNAAIRESQRGGRRAGHFVHGLRQR